MCHKKHYQKFMFNWKIVLLWYLKRYMIKRGAFTECIHISIDRYFFNKGSNHCMTHSKDLRQLHPLLQFGAVHHDVIRGDPGGAPSGLWSKYRLWLRQGQGGSHTGNFNGAIRGREDKTPVIMAWSFVDVYICMSLCLSVCLFVFLSVNFLLLLIMYYSSVCVCFVLT